ncbi:MFS transporter [Sphingomonas sp. CL5.1]|uniref:MFS transporter n=1 Tax=Sphingomonas sp. CL5.1 TaxID=2653203 RepID=UPI001581D999|nr:MFS transporter [Sphingomonas sp. CL5.1]QKR99789.1 MFS transporter [Sphingomonas sp. CL5.1]
MTAHLPLDDIRRRLDAAPMSGTQILAVATTILLSAVDGFDVLSVTFAAPAITHDWGIDKAALGVVLSAGLAGMAAGSFFLAPLADWLGRRGLVIASLILMAIGSCGSAAAGSIGVLTAWRVVTGLGIGACISVINPLAAEFANARRRPFAVALMSLGYPAGGLVGGLVAAALMPVHGWRAVFVAGAVATIALMPVVLLFLPESPGFLAARGGTHHLARLDRLLARFGHHDIAAQPSGRPREIGYRLVFAPDRIGTTLRLSVANLLVASVSYYLLSWLPQLVADTGQDAATASLISATMSLIGIVGGLLVGGLANRFGQSRVTAVAVIGLGLSIAAFGAASLSTMSLFVLAGLCGFCLFGSAAGFYGVLARGFGDAERASGSGFVIGVGRVSSAVSPLLAGYLFAAGFGRTGVSGGFAAAALVAAALLFIHARKGSVR